MFQKWVAWLRQSRHRKLLQMALQTPCTPQGPLSPAEREALVEPQLRQWNGDHLLNAGRAESALLRLHEDHPSIFVYDVHGKRVLARRKTGRAARHAVDPLDARMYAKRVNHYGTLLAEVAEQRGGRDSFSLAVDLRDIPVDHEEFPVFGFQRLKGAGNPLLPDVDFFHHGWYLDDDDRLTYDQKSVSACFAGASTGRTLTADDIRLHASERLSLAFQFQSNPRVHFVIANSVHCVDAEADSLLRAQPYFSAPIAWQEQLRHRFLISVDGNGATCSRVVKSLRSQSVLVKFESPYELFYFPLLKPGVHFLSAARAQDVERYLDEENALPGCHARVAIAGAAFARRVLVAPTVLDYTRLLIDRYASLFSRR